MRRDEHNEFSEDDLDPNNAEESLSGDKEPNHSQKLAIAEALNNPYDHEYQ